MASRFPDDGESLGQFNFRLYFGAVLREALQRARDGVLEPQWRENVASSSKLSALNVSDPYGVLLPIVTAINEMPRAAWEPGQSPGWRTAVDSWFAASRAALVDYRTILLEQHAAIERHGHSIVTAARFTAHSVEEVLTRIAATDADKDDVARKSLSTFIVQRDNLTASYGAALAAGGEQVDWRAWLRGRVATWDNEQAANVARITMQQQYSYLERLPAYW
ncbi:hypothetical protein [Mycolicibacterium goodii]|uniref:hypothetical protein n=1 Tax=Mycolicibacterium goodii TaxID=134601 RepID=UPI001BDD562E|nr:hypothetical protein [Mycolicibacterium goodii]MBU8841573.1 hypothetical protein [Mycolicibacterium goodii]